MYSTSNERRAATLDTAMRDLERIEERPLGQSDSRYLVLWGAGLASLIAVLLAVAANVDRADNANADTPDPLAALTIDTGDLIEEKKVRSTDVDPEQLTFPSALATHDPPEVVAALAAATAEYEHPDPLEQPTSLAEITAGLPGAVVASPDQEVVARAAVQDPMVNGKASTHGNVQPAAQRGSEGKFTLQVLSYRTPREAESFASSLRKRGHAAYVITSNVPERGQHWRVRVGPFTNRQKAIAYKAKFEKSEGISAYIVHNR